MKSLYLLRHAKSSWSEPDLADRERPLNPRGRRDAPRMGAALSRRFPPMRFHVSPAVRAQLTFDGLCRGWSGLDDSWRVTDDALYTFDADDLLGWLQASAADVDSLAVIGHNPALTDLVNFLAGDGALDNLPTCGWIELSLPISAWDSVANAEGEGVIAFSLFPRELSDGD